MNQPGYPALTLPLATPLAILGLVGGKGMSLARLATAGLPVPAGFHLTTEAYRYFVSANNLQDEIARYLSLAQSDSPATLAQVEAAIRARFEGARLPEDLATAILQEHEKLEELAVAVRSSATAEDLPEHSFAGQQETFLNQSRETVLDAVRHCWASLWTARAIGYRQRLGIAHDTVTMGVVIQRMIPAEVSGVLFTAHPTTGDRSELVINASFGLGESIVEGLVTPDTYVLDRTTLRCKHRAIGTKAVQRVSGPAPGTSTEAVPEGRQAAAALSDEQVRQIGSLALEAEALFGGVPQDVEWALSEGHCWLLQARPITALPPMPLQEVQWEPPTPGSSWVRRQVVENMPDPLSPLFAELYLEGLEHSSVAMQSAMGVPRRMMENLFDPPMFTTVNGYAYMRANMNLRWWTPLVVIPAMVVGVTRILRNAGIQYWQETLPTYLATVERWKALDRAASEETLLAGVRALAEADAHYWFACTMAIGTAKVTDGILDRFLALAARRRGLSSGRFLRGFPSKTLEAQAVLESIAEQIRASEPLRELVHTTPGPQLMETLAGHPAGGVVLAELQAYLDRFGHQIYTLDFAEPTQSDQPLPVLLALKAWVAQPGQAVQHRQVELAHAREELVKHIARSFDPLRRRVFWWVLQAAQHFGPYREEALFYMGAAWPPLRRLALELGRRLVMAGALGHAEDVFFLTSEELASAIRARAAGQPRPDLVKLSRERRDLRTAQQRLHPPAAVPPSFGFKLGPIDLSSRESQRRNPTTGSTLAGFAVSPGQVTAPASVILSPADFHQMKPGTILVCPTTTPAWTPLFAQARGLVTDIGGVLAHGSIVAREYGIPAVMGTGNATQRIANGQEVTINGDTGTVTLVESRPVEGISA